jgi:hypothetical protein
MYYPTAAAASIPLPLFPMTGKVDVINYSSMVF